MAKNKIILDVKVDDKGGTKKLGVESKKTAKNLDKLGTSARTADRNVKGAAQASSSGTKNFSKMAQGAGGLVGVYATLAATAFAVSAAFNFLKSSMDFKNLLEGQKALGAVTGVAYKTISDSLVEATNGQLKYAEAAKAAAIGTASGISPDQLARLGSAAKNASIALGRDLGDSFDRLIRGVTKAEPELLDELGIILRLENATRKYGLQIGKSKDELNEFERSQAVTNEVLSQAERKFGAMEKMMDPTAFALNQFAKSFDDVVNTIKSGIAGPLATIAGFLANNIMALSGAIALFAGGLLKQVLPSMSAWRQSSIDTAKQVKRDQEAIRLRLERTKKSYEKLKLARMNDASVAKKAGAKILESTEGGTKSGQGGLDFLKGNASSKKSQAAADKALKHAEEQLRTSAKKRTGLLKDMNARQVNDLRRSYEIRAGIEKKGMAHFEFQMKRGGLAIDHYKLKLTGMVASTKAGFAMIGTAAARLGTLVGKAFFWLSLLSIAIDAFKSLKDVIFPASEETQKLEKFTESLTSKYKTLGAELSRTIDVMKDYMLLNSSDMIQTRGKAVGSLGLQKMMQEINATIEQYPDRTIPEELFNEMIRATDAAGELDSGFKGLSIALNEGTQLTSAQKVNMQKLGDELQNVGIEFDRLPSKVNAMNSELTKLIGTIKKPFGQEFKASLSTLVTSQAVVIKGRKQELEKQQTALDKFREENNLDKDGNPKVQHVIRGSDSKGLNQRSTNQLFVIPKETQDAHAHLIEQLGLEKDLILDTEKSRETNVLFAEALGKAQTELNRLGNEQADAASHASKMKTAGLTIDEKIINVNASNVVLLASANDEKQVLLTLQAQERSLTDEEGNARDKMRDGDVELLALVKERIKVAEKKLTQAEEEIKLGLKINHGTITDLGVQNLVNIAIRERLQITQDILDATRELKNLQAGGQGVYGIALAKQVREQKQRELANKLTGAQSDERGAQSVLTTEENKTLGVDYDPQKVAGAQAAFNAAQQRRLSAEDDISIFGRRAQIIVENSKAETELLGLQVSALSLNPAMTAYNTALLEAKKEGLSLSINQKQVLYAEIQAQTMLTTLLEQKTQLFDGIASSISGAFTSIVTGTASAKQAFANMAISILNQISQMIVQMMVMRMLMAAFGMGAPVPTTAMQDPGMVSQMNYGDGFGNFARYGGVFSEGKKTQGYATGGVARGSTSGYPATLHGTEAVVPLPNGRSIPVDMKDSGATNNNIVVNISTDGQSTKEGSSGPDMDRLGSAVAAAVQAELHTQKRSGGILNPYGVA